MFHDFSHRIHVCGISTYVYLKHQVNLGKYTSPMDPMGMILKNH